MEDIYRKAADLIDLTQGTPGGKRLLQSCRWDQIYQVEVSGKKPFYIDFKEGNVSVNKGESKEGDFLDVTHVIFNDKETLRKIFEGKKDSVDAHFRDRSIKFLPSGKHFRIAFFHQLLRFGREVILAKMVQDFEKG